MCGNKNIKTLSFLYVLLVLGTLCYGKPTRLSVIARSRRSVWDDLFSYFDDTSEEDEDSSEDYAEIPVTYSERKYELCRDCNISYVSVNSTQYINHYNQVTTEKEANGKPTPKATSMEKATTNGATQTKDTQTQTTVSPKDMMMTTPTTAGMSTFFTTTTTTTPRASNEFIQERGTSAVANASDMPTTITTSTTTTMDATTTNSVDMTTIPPAPVPLDEEPLLEPSDKMPSEEALTSEGNV